MFSFFFSIFGVSTLWLATTGGHLDVCKLLVSSGADMQQEVKSGYSPWLVACCEGHADIVDFFVVNGAKIEQANGDGLTALIVAAHHGKIQGRS
uniref:ANK_REP_REGION domain-containing protein n=1 Tax=Globodera pallida TaxID=36090 RepID=A0A183CE18_GLOPA